MPEGRWQSLAKKFSLEKSSKLRLGLRVGTLGSNILSCARGMYFGLALLWKSVCYFTYCPPSGNYHPFQNHYTHEIIIFELFRGLQLQLSGVFQIN